MTGAYTCHRLRDEARNQGIELSIVGVHDCLLRDGRILNSSIKLEKRDFLINRYKWGEIKDSLNELASRTYNRISCYEIFKNKYEQLKRLRCEEFVVPRYLLASLGLPFEFLASQLKTPFVVKALENSMGREVFLIKDEREYLKLRSESPIDKEWLFEEFIEHSYGKDLRLFAIRGEAVACMMRKSKGDFRANVALGASVTPVEITPRLQKIARDICVQSGLDFVGIDLLFAPEGYALCEINVMPGLEGIEEASGKNIAGKLIDMIKGDFKNE